jgi:hypothetical protein
VIGSQQRVGFLHYGSFFGRFIRRMPRMQNVDEFVYDGGLLIEPRHLNRKIVIFLAQDANEGFFGREIPLDITHGNAPECMVGHHLKRNIPLGQLQFLLPDLERFVKIRLVRRKCQRNKGKDVQQDICILQHISLAWAATEWIFFNFLESGRNIEHAGIDTAGRKTRVIDGHFHEGSAAGWLRRGVARGGLHRGVGILLLFLPETA